MSLKDKEGFPKERILSEAEALFAKKGYVAVSVREITKAAGCNLAAVNYHFGNKRNLYIEVFRSRWVPRAKRMQEHARKSLSAKDSSSPTAEVQALARAFLEGPLSDRERQLHFQLMARELAWPTEAFELVADQVMRPFLKELADRLRPVLPEGLGEEGRLLKVLSVLGMVLYFNFAREAVMRITGREYSAAFKDRLVDHIIEFSLTGLGANRNGGLR
ncbi:MAG: CerR family C-terminal domain-containing protein [Thermodesulfobacteriota bacterium]|nr:CerR family C-terminal domain-containing protein [Thermodesulfobacteriota bacterium]